MKKRRPLTAVLYLEAVSVNVMLSMVDDFIVSIITLAAGGWDLLRTKQAVNQFMKTNLVLRVQVKD